MSKQNYLKTNHILIHMNYYTTEDGKQHPYNKQLENNKFMQITNPKQELKPNASSED